VRRLLSEVGAYLRDLGRDTIQGWNAFFFSPADPTALGLIRVAVGLLAFWSLFVFGLDLHDYFSSTGWAEPGVIRSVEGPLAWSFWFLVPDAWLRPVWFVCLAVLGLFTLGLYSRATAVLTWIIVVSTVRRVPIALHGFDQVLSTLALYLAVTGASGQAVSFDRFLRRWRQARALAAQAFKRGGTAGRRVAPDEPARPLATVSANLALRLIQLHLTVIYGMAGLAKLQGPSWWDGTAIWKTMATGEFVVLNFTALAAWPVLINLVTHASLALELLYPVLVWVKRTRPIMIAGMVMLHLGIAVMSPGLTEFALAMIVANLAFVSGTWLRSRAVGPSQPGLRVLYDGGCPRCRASVALVTAADPDRVVEPVDLTTADLGKVHPSLTREDCLRSMHAVSASGQVTRGFDAVRAVAGRLPLFWPLAAIGYFPGVAWAGRLVYNWVAATRSRDVACTDLVCGIHSTAPLTVPRERGRAQEHHNTIVTMTDTEEAPRS
jgi:predicted DCC family thiol-disulfide oxidoreductase YuxK